MPNPRDLDLLARSLSGDWQSRAGLFKKFIWHNPRVRRMGDAYRNPDDFLHDCLTNVLRTGHSFDRTGDLGEWIETTAAWTALERQRMRDIDAAGAAGRIRMCAGIEGDEANHRTRLSAYVPPLKTKDSPSGRIKDLVGDLPFALISARAIGDHSWDEVAASARKPVNTIGPILARSVDRLSRFFGAPPPLNDDLEAVFADAIREDAKANHSDPLKAKGRMISLQLDPVFYVVTPAMRAIGLTVPGEVRTITLWNAAKASTPPGDALREHLSKCNYCADQLRSLLLMQQALESPPNTDFLLCPGGFTLIDTPEEGFEGFEAFDKHLEHCVSCSDERTRLIETAEGSGKSTGEGVSRTTLALIAAAVFLVVTGFFAWHFLFAAKQSTVNSADVKPADTPRPPVATNPRYSDLAQPIAVNDQKWLGSVLPKNEDAFVELRASMENGQLAAAMVSTMKYREEDPGIQMLYAVGLYGQGAMSDGYYAMVKAEAMPPRNSFRCWTMMQCALIMGQLKVVEREVDHLSTDPAYAQKAKDLWAKAKARAK